jgi:fructuronate reductase/mannitol 2-dehydrogenase
MTPESSAPWPSFSTRASAVAPSSSTRPGPHRDRQVPLALNEQNLQRLRHRVSVPAYRRDRLTSGVVHLGVGNFHRAHQAVYFDDLANLGLTRWGITGIGFRSRRIREALPSQDLLYTVLELSAAGSRARVVGALRRYVFAPERPARVLAVLSAPRTRLVTLTLTGDGYPYDPTAGLVLDDDLRRELADPTRPSTAFGYLVAGLDQRRRSGMRGLTILSCDNRPDSAVAARATVLALAELRDPGLARWIEDQVTFPDSMVDRITPATGDAHRLQVAEQLGISDRWPVVTEPFSQWVIEDAFVRARPPLDHVGAQFVADVAPYKQVKTSLLNGTHCALGYLGTLAGFADTGEAMADPLLRSYVARLMASEVAPLLPSGVRLDLADYQRTVLERLANPSLVDPLSRLAGRASTKAPAYLLPSLLAAAQQGRPHQLLALAVAAWFRCLRGSDLEGRPVALADARASELRELALAGGDDPRPLLGLTEVFGALGQHRPVLATLHRLLRSLDEHGWRVTVSTSLGRDSVRSATCPFAGASAPTTPAEVNDLAVS